MATRGLEAAPAQPSPLAELAERYGIEPSFRDARGEIVTTSPETQERLLAAMGVEASSDAAIAGAIAALDRAEWSRPLPPVLVIHADAGPPWVEVTLPAGTDAIAWRLSLEEGSERSGRQARAALDLIAEREVEGIRYERRRLALDALPFGYHRFELTAHPAEAALIVSPGRCWLPPAIEAGDKLWGIAAQLYLLRSERNWGIGDFGDLRRLVADATRRDADVIGLNPLHAMFLDDPEAASPYSPASRLLLNALFIDMEAVPGAGATAFRDFVGAPAFRARLERARAAPLVDYGAVAALKLEGLQALFAAFREAADPAASRAFQAFVAEGGAALRRTCIFLALRRHFAGREPDLADWHRWPPAFQDPDSPAVAAFAAQNRDSVEFLLWLQWTADGQLAEAAAAAERGGMGIGLYRDLAVGADRAGAETWANAASVVSGAQVGAPPDVFNPAGQNWGLPPFHPRALREEAYRSFVELVRANMRHAGGLRIDHVMALQHLYWIPQGCGAPEGAYVAYPMEDLVGILALESQRHRCLVVGEDLGTVPEGFRERMAAANVLSYRVLFFEQDEDGAFVPPGEYPRLSLAVAGSHDLPTLRGWWEGRDIALKERLGLYPDAGEAERQRERRARDRARLLEALIAEELLEANADEIGVDAFIAMAHAFLARSASALAIVQLDDMTGEADPVNVPATATEHPNWRRKYALTLEELAEAPLAAQLADVMRGRKPPQDAA